MLFHGRYDRARRVQREASGLDQEEEQKRREEQPEEKLEKGDMAAMLFSSFFTLFLPAVGVLTAVVLLSMLLFRLL